MILRSGQIKNKMLKNRPVEPDQKIELAQENVNFEEARGLTKHEVNFNNVTIWQLVTQSNKGATPKTINPFTGRDRGFVLMNTKTLQKKYKITNLNRRTVPNNPNQSLFCDSIDLPVPELSKSTNPQLDKEITGNETFQTDSFLGENNQFLIETNEFIIFML